MSQNKKLNLRDATIDLTFSPARVLLKHRGFMEGEIINIDSDESFEFSNPTPITSKQIKNNEAQIARNQVSVFLLKFSTVLIWNTYVTVLQHSSATYLYGLKLLVKMSLRHSHKKYVDFLLICEREFYYDRDWINKTNHIFVFIIKYNNRSNYFFLLQIINDPKEVHVGQCPICWDELGKNPLSSTWCGHVFCTECLEQSLKQEKRCPTCRRCVNGRTKYHPLFLPQ